MSDIDTDTATERNTGTDARPSAMAAPTGHRRTHSRIDVQVLGFLRKELAAIIRQPRLLLVLVVGPFVLLLLFGVGYDPEQVVLRTTFVGPSGSVYERKVDEVSDSLQRYVENAGFTDDLAAAERQLRDGDIDAIVVFPSEPAESVLAGEQASIIVLHDKIDPLQLTAVEVSARVAVQELNASILETVIGRAQDVLVPFEQAVADASASVDDLAAAVDRGDDDEVERILDELTISTRALETVAQVSGELATELGTDDATTANLAQLSEAARLLDDLAVDLADGDDVDADDVEEVQIALAQVSEIGETAVTIDPRVLVRPFTSDTASLQREPIAVNDFFAPSAVALLLQHMVLTFAAMSLVSDRTLGLFEVFRVGPVDALRVLAGKYLSFLLIGAVVAAALLASVVLLLDVPMRGDLAWVAIGVFGLLAASIGLGMMLSLLAKTDVQAVQFAMLALLAGLFFGGFFLDLDAFRYPVKFVSWLLPVSYGVRLLRDVMLRGVSPDLFDLLGLAVTTIGFALASWYLLRRQLRIR